MNIEVTDKQAEAIRLIGYWWRCNVAQWKLFENNTDADIPPSDVVLHFSGSGASAMVLAEHLNAVADIDTNINPGDSLL
jgi:hypothetical protein